MILFMFHPKGDGVLARGSGTVASKLKIWYCSWKKLYTYVSWAIINFSITVVRRVQRCFEACLRNHTIFSSITFSLIGQYNYAKNYLS